MAKYGITWWGQQWLNSLTKIDFSNRLPRGRKYAGNGSVRSIEITENKILAKVKGSRPKPYDITITVPVFPEKQKTTLIDLIGNNPQLLSKLLNKELSPELDNLAREKDIDIFPSSWKDFGMNCSCPDWAVPCKHLAAVLYIVSNEIDKNPFILLKLHGLDLLRAFENDNTVKKLNSIPEVSALVSSQTISENKTLDVVALLNIDLSKLSANPPDILQLLAPTPVFYQKDFKDLLQKATNAVAKNIKSFELNQAERTVIFDPDSSVKIVFNENLMSVVAEISTSEKTIQVPLGLLVDILKSIEYKHLTSIDFSWVFLHKTYMYSLQLLSNKLYYPKIWAADKDKYLLRYLPAIFSDDAGKVFSQMLLHLPGSLVEVQMDNKKKTKYSITGTDQQLLHLCGIFLSHIITETFNSDKFPSVWYEKQEHKNVIELFTNGHAGDFNTFQTKQLPSSIYQWLSVFDIHSRVFTPVLQVEEHSNGFSLSLLVSETDSKSASPVMLADIFKLKKYDKIRFEILKDLNIVANYLPQINTILSQKGEKDIIVPLAEFSKLLINILPIVRLLGVSILLPKSLKTLVYPNLYLQLKKGPGKQISIKSLVGLTELLDYDWQITLGDRQMDVNEFLKMVKGLQGLVKLKDQYIFLDEAQIKALQKNLDKNRELSSFQLIHAALSEEIAGAKVGLSADVANLVKDILRGNSPVVPKDLQASLRPYQLRGFEWMARNAELGMGSIIADDMGLGKTLQVITLLLHFKNQGQLTKNKALVVVPTSLISNWEREIVRFAPSLTSYSFHGTGRTDDFKDAHIVITSYGMVRNNLAIFDKHKWHTLIVDEAQNIKNPSSEQTKALKKIKADIRIAMSGTPVENRLSEYWSIFDFSNKGYLGNYNWFNEEFSKPIQQNHDMGKVDHFRRITAPFLLRRMKTDKSIITDLPDKVENNHYTSLSTNQAALYQNLVTETMTVIESSEGIERKGLVLKLMMALKQIGNHPYQYLKQGKKELILSGKSQLLVELVESIIENDEKVLIFTQFKEMGVLLSEFISVNTNEKPLFLHGGCSRKQRDEMVDKFQNHHPRVFILSLKAGGTGLNLTAASHVIHYDLWWNPAVESQATDRAFRIGQKKNVIVSRLINKGTIEEKIDKMIQEKRALADLTITTGETWLGNLSNDEIKNLVKLEL
jgi:SNF2 family DNA or RNA helicase/uncharacterized Zn finger protein